MIRSAVIRLGDVASTAELRIDPHFFTLSDTVRDIFAGLDHAVALRAPLVQVRNGLNLPENAYDLEAEDAEYRYASVGAISQFSLRADRCVPLRAPDQYSYKTPLSEAGVGSNDVLVTRSGTPGIAWPFAAEPPEDATIIASGFIIRLTVIDCSVIDPVFIAAILNHPVWRVQTSAMATGKRQRNLSQEQLAQVLLPDVTADDQLAIRHSYADALAEIRRANNAELGIRPLCDDVLRRCLRFRFSSLNLGSVSMDRVTLRDVASSPALRMDGRYHRGEVRDVVRPLDGVPIVFLREILSRPIIKGRQPTLLYNGDVSEARVIATATLQAGTVVSDLSKATTDEELDRAGDRLVQYADVLMAMDGEGSIGKAAVFDGSFDAITDSHVAILRPKSAALADALSCYINSSLGQAQIMLATSGSTGQTQVARDDVERLRVPVELLDAADRISEEVRMALRTFEPVTANVRGAIARHSASVTATLLRGKAFDRSARTALKSFASEKALRTLLTTLRPELF